MSKTAAYCLLSCVGCLSTVALCIWPLRKTGHLRDLAHPKGWRALYSVGDSTLDLLAACIVSYALHLLVLLPVLLRAPRRDPPHCPNILRAQYVVSYIYQQAFLGKAVASAMLSGSSVYPKGREAGILCMYVTIVVGVVSNWVQSGAFVHLASTLKPQSADHDGVRQPLLESHPLDGTMMLNGRGDHQTARPGLPAADSDETTQQVEVKSATIVDLLVLAAPDSLFLVVAFAAGMLAAIGQALILHYTGKSIDAATHDGVPWHTFTNLVTALVYTALGTALFTAIRGSVFTMVSVRINRRLRERLFSQLLLQETGFFDTTKTGDITSRLSADTTTMSDQISLNANVFARCIMQSLTVLWFMFAANWRLTIVTFILVPINLQLCSTYGKYYKRLVKEMQTALSGANVVAEEALGSITTIRAHSAEVGLFAAYAAELLKYYYLTMKAAVAYGLYMLIATFLPQAVAAIVLLYGGHLALEGSLSRADLVSFMFYQQSLVSTMNIIGDVFSALTAAVGAAEKVLQLMKRRPREDPPGSLVKVTCSGKVELKNVSFAYPARPQRLVLQSVSICIDPGEAVALVGPSGSGKSSIVKLIERFYQPLTGQVLLDDRSVNDYDPQWLKKHIAIVGQEPVLYGRSIYRNVILGLEAEDGNDEVPTREEVADAARLANAHEFIMDLPHGYDTECGDKGSSLSGGQKQRIAIARALVRNPSVLLLDEATSALDTESEALVQEALDRVMHGRTTVIIAHRLSTIANANRIVVMSKGSVVESGTHEQLAEQAGVYAGLVRRQLGGSKKSFASMTTVGSVAVLSDMAS